MGQPNHKNMKSKTSDSSKNGGSEQCSQVPDQESQDSSVLSSIISAASNVLYATPILAKPKTWPVKRILWDHYIDPKDSNGYKP